MKKIFRFHVTSEQIAVVEDVVKRGNLQCIIVVPWCSPANVTLEIRLPKVWKIENLLLQIFHECSVRFIASYFQCFPDVLKEMHMTELDDDGGVDMLRRHANGFVVITNQCQKFVTGVLEFREKLHESLEVLGGSKQTDRNVMREVIDAVDERNLPVVTFHRHELPIHDEKAAETFGIAVTEGDIVVVR